MKDFKNTRFLPIICLLGTSTLLTACGSATTTSTSGNPTYQITEEGSELKMSNQPLVPHWFPDELLDWNPETDQTLAFNQAMIPLAQRIPTATLPLLHEKQNHDTKVVAISIMNASTSGNPSQGSNKFNANTFSYWQYIDQLVYWGGSAGEGIIVPPSADVIDAAHTNGVPVLGTVFFPMTAHGGKLEWLDLFLEQDENGTFPMVEQLIKVADSYGFEGWFINQETESTDEAPLTPEHSKKMQAFIKAFKLAAPHLEIMWYDSMTEAGEMDWQNALTAENDFFLIDENQDAVADSMFLNFWWTNQKYVPEKLLEKSHELATTLTLDPYNLYAGIDVQSEGFSTPVQWELFEKGNTTQTSLGLYAPNWTYTSASSPDEFEMKENRFWVNEFQNPAKLTQTIDEQWRGISTYVVERSVVQSLPFQTHFNVGNGYNFFIDGEKVSSLDWNNRSLADVLPTYRWLFDHSGSNDLSVSLDYADAVYGGNSLKVMGSLDANMPSNWTLYSANLELPSNTTLTTRAQANQPMALNLALTFGDGSSSVIAGETLDATWTTLTYDLSEYAGKTITSIGYELVSTSAIDKLVFNLGQLSITDTETLPTLDMVDLKIENPLFEEDDMFAGVTLDWTKVEHAKHYEIYRENPDGSLSFLGATPNDIFFVSALKRAETGKETTFAVCAINDDYTRGEKQSAVLEWPDNSIPKANFSVNTTLAAPNTPITFTNLSSEISESYEWHLPGSSDENSTDANPTVTYEQPGVYLVTLTARNSEGEHSHTLEGLITISTDAPAVLENLSLGKTATASSFIHDGEAPEFVLDDLDSTKWCAVGPAPHDITIDLGADMLVSEVHIGHAEFGNESPDMNTQSYIIETSLDGLEFTQVAEVKKNTLGQTIDTFAATTARYVKITVVKPTQGADSAVRIYAIDVKGMQ